MVHCSCMVRALDIIPFICLNFGCSSSHHLLQVAMQEYILNYSQSVIYVAQCIRNNSRLFRPIRTSPHHFQKLLLRVILCEHLRLCSFHVYTFTVKHTYNIFTAHKRQRWLKEALESISKAPTETDLLKAALAVLKVDTTYFGF